MLIHFVSRLYSVSAPSTELNCKCGLSCSSNYNWLWVDRVSSARCSQPLMFTTRRGTTFGLMSRVENPLFDDPSGTPEPAAGQGETVSVEDGGPVSQSGGRTASVPAILARPEKPANLAELLRTALLKRWDTLSFCLLYTSPSPRD